VRRRQIEITRVQNCVNLQVGNYVAVDTEIYKYLSAVDVKYSIIIEIYFFFYYPENRKV